MAYLDKAREAIKKVKDQPELESTILFQIAQTQVFGGDVINAENNMSLVDNVITQYPKADFDMGLYWFIKARIALSKRAYKEALVAIDNNIKAEAHLPQDTFTAPTYILKSEILNFMGEYKNSYEIIKKIAQQEVSNNHIEHEIYARILTQLSRAEAGLGLTDTALKNAITACGIFKKEIEKYKITTIINIDFAAALVAKADALTMKGDFEAALIAYNEAEAIYFRRYLGFK